MSDYKVDSGHNLTFIITVITHLLTVIQPVRNYDSVLVVVYMVLSGITESNATDPEYSPCPVTQRHLLDNMRTTAVIGTSVQTRSLQLFTS